jgi:hypothetical protein
MLDGAFVVTYELLPDSRTQITEVTWSLVAAICQGPPGNLILVTLGHLLPVCPHDPEICHTLVMSFVLCHWWW